MGGGGWGGGLRIVQVNDKDVFGVSLFTGDGSKMDDVWR